MLDGQLAARWPAYFTRGRDGKDIAHQGWRCMDVSVQLAVRPQYKLAGQARMRERTGRASMEVIRVGRSGMAKSMALTAFSGSYNRIETLTALWTLDSAVDFEVHAIPLHSRQIIVGAEHVHQPIVHPAMRADSCLTGYDARRGRGCDVPGQAGHRRACLQFGSRKHVRPFFPIVGCVFEG